MLNLSADSSGTARVIQTNKPPTVYLDHWALMSIAQDTSLGTRFIATLQNRHGTLALSWVNLAEFAKITDRRQIQAVEQFVDAISPQLFFIAVDPWAVIQSEDEVLQGHRTQSERGHLGLLKIFLIRKGMPSLNPLTARGRFSNLRKPRILRRLDELGGQFISRIESLRNRYAEDSEFAKAVRKLPKGSAFLPATRFLLRELPGVFVKNPMQQLTRNDAAAFSTPLSRWRIVITCCWMAIGRLKHPLPRIASMALVKSKLLPKRSPRDRTGCSDFCIPLNQKRLNC